MTWQEFLKLKRERPDIEFCGIAVEDSMSAPAQAQLAEHESAGSNLEQKFLTLWTQLGGPELEREYRFHPQRRWRFDFVHIATKVSIEIDGGTWTDQRTGHNWGTGIRQDCEKRNAAVLLGWSLFRLTSDMLRAEEAATHLEPIIEFVQGGNDE